MSVFYVIFEGETPSNQLREIDVSLKNPQARCPRTSVCRWASNLFSIANVLKFVAPQHAVALQEIKRIGLTQVCQLIRFYSFKLQFSFYRKD